MLRYFKHLLILFCLIAVLVLPYFVFAEEEGKSSLSPLDELSNVGRKGGYAEATEYSFSQILGTVVSAALSLLGVIFIILIIYSGYNWMTAAGNEEKVTKAKDTIWRAVIGLIIIVSAYAIWEFISLNLVSK